AKSRTRASSARHRAWPLLPRVPASSGRSFVVALIERRRCWSSLRALGGLLPGLALSLARVVLIQQVLEPVRDPLLAPIVEVGLEHLAKLNQGFTAEPAAPFACLNITVHHRTWPQWLLPGRSRP